MSDINSVREEFMEFMFQGLDHGINSIKDGGGPLIPFTITQANDKRDLQRFVTEKIEDGQLRAQEYLSSLAEKPDFALIAFDGYVTTDGERSDAIIVKAFDKEEDEGLIFAQRYKHKPENKGIEPVGNAALIGKEPNIIRNKGG